MTRAHAPISTIQPLTPRAASRSAVRLRSVTCAIAVAFVLLATGSAWADSHGDEAPPSTPPPGTLGPEGMVPEEGAVASAPGDTTAEGAVPLEAVGHVPGPGEGVYGDPPNFATGDPETRGWAYDTEYFFALTRGLKTDTDLGTVGQRWVRPWTLTMDVVTLPTAALAGLSGRPPAEEAAVESEAESAAEPVSESSTEPESTDTPTEAPSEGAEPMSDESAEPEAAGSETPPSA